MCLNGILLGTYWGLTYGGISITKGCPSRGPLSPFLFVTSIEYLLHLTKQVVDEGKLELYVNGREKIEGGADASFCRWRCFLLLSISEILGHYQNNLGQLLQLFKDIGLLCKEQYFVLQKSEWRPWSHIDTWVSNKIISNQVFRCSNYWQIYLTPWLRFSYCRSWNHTCEMEQEVTILHRALPTCRLGVTLKIWVPPSK